MPFCHFDSEQRPNSSLRKGISKRKTIVIGYDDPSSYEEYASYSMTILYGIDSIYHIL